MNSKRKTQIYTSLKKLENGSFEENDIRLLLIEIRDLLEAESFLWEICNFVAHPNRDKGICHNRVNSRHAKMQFIKDGTEKLKREGIIELNTDKDWGFFSDKILDYIQTPKIEKKLFDIIILEGIEEIDNERFLEFYKMSKSKIRDLIIKAYKKENGYYVISEKIDNKLYLLIDDLLKFIRGTITGKSAFQQEDIEEDLMQGITRIIRNENFEIDVSEIANQLEGVVVCIICILHEANFTLFDNSSAKSYMTINKYDRAKPGEVLNLNLYADANNFCFPVITTRINSLHYINATYEELEKFECKEMPWINAMRNNEKLQLIEQTV